jgi:peroxiredoxin
MIPGLIVLQDQYASRGFKMIGISTDRTSDIVASFAKENKINYLLLMADEKVINEYGGISAIPTTFIIDKKGVVRYRHIGSQDMSLLQKQVESLLAE